MYAYRIIATIFILIILIENVLANKFNKIYTTILKCTILINKFIAFNEITQIYLVSGDKSYVDEYKKNIDIVNGEKAWSRFSIHQTSIFDNFDKQLNIDDLIDELEFDDKEKLMYKNISEDMKQITWKQIESINWYNGKCDNKNVYKNKYDNDKFSLSSSNFDFESDSKIDIKIMKNKAVENFENASTTELIRNTTHKLEVLRSRIIFRLFQSVEVIKTIYFLLLVLFFIFSLTSFQRTTGKIRTFSIWNYGVFILSLLFLYLGIKLYNTQYNKYKSTILVILLQSIPQKLSQEVRTYVKTGDEKYKDNYWDVVDASGGFFSWDPILQFYGINEYHDIETLKKEVNLDESEIRILNKSQSDMNTMIWKENQSFNWFNKRWDKDNQAKKLFARQQYKSLITFYGTYDKGEGDKESDIEKPKNPVQDSVNNLYDNEYIIAYNKIRLYLLEGYSKIHERTTINITRSRVMFYIIIITYIFFSLNLDNLF